MSLRPGMTCSIATGTRSAFTQTAKQLIQVNVNHTPSSTPKATAICAILHVGEDAYVLRTAICATRTAMAHVPVSELTSAS